MHEQLHDSPSDSQLGSVLSSIGGYSNKMPAVVRRFRS